MAWRLQSEGTTLGRFDPRVMISRAAGYLIRQGPVSAQERWEENAGYSPSTLATVIAGLVCAAEFAKQQDETSMADFILAYADWLAAHLEEWTVTTAGCPDGSVSEFTFFWKEAQRWEGRNHSVAVSGPTKPATSTP